MRCLIRITLILSLLLPIPVCAEESGGKPIPCGHDVPVQKQFMGQVAKFYDRNFAQAYAKYGTRDPKWDDKAVKFLTQFAGLMTPSEVDREVRFRECLELGKALMESGCADPLVRSSYGICLFLDGKHLDAALELDRAIKDLEESDYPKYRASITATYLIDLSDNAWRLLSNDKQHYVDKAIALLAESWKDGSYAPDEQRVTLYVYDHTFHKHLRRHWKKLVKAGEGADPYVLNVIAGQNHALDAYSNAGKGYSGTRDTAYWETREMYYTEARRALLQAWRLHPEFPEAAANMIDVAKSGYFDQDDTPRLWFDWAVEAEFDYLPAYTQLLGALVPRWGGSHEEMYAFGMECLATRRFDTEVPWMLIRVLKELTSDSGDPKYWRQPEMKKALITLFDEYAKQTSTLNSENLRKTRMAAIAWYAGEYAEARKWLDEVGDGAQEGVFGSLFGASYRTARENCYVYGSKYAEGVDKADDIYKERKWAEARSAYEKLLNTCQDDKEVISYLQKQIARTDKWEELEKGEWMDFMPPADLSDWTVSRGDWSVEEDGTVTGTSKNRVASPCILLGEADVGSRFQIEGEIFFVKPPPSRSWSGGVEDAPIIVTDKAQNAGVVVSNGHRTVEVLFGNDDGRLSISCDFSHKFVPHVLNMVNQDNKFTINYWDGLISVELNGKKFECPVYAWQKPWSGGSWFVGFCGQDWHDEVVVKFSSVRLRILSERPHDARMLFN